MLTLNFSTSATVVREHWETVDLGHGASVDVLVRRPTAEQVITEYGSRAAADDDVGACSAAAVHRLRSTFIDWRGVTDEAGRDVPFNGEALHRLIEQYPLSIHRLMRLANLAFAGLSGDEQKNCSAPSATSSTSVTASATDCSTSGCNSESPASPAAPSA